MIKLMQGDCLELLKTIPDESIDLIVCDLPYGTTDCGWDATLPFDQMWAEYNRVVKSYSAIVLFGNEPFTSQLICSNLKGFKYRLDWNKVIPSGFLYSKYRPMQQTEDIAVFTKSGEKTKYNPQLTKRDMPIKSGGNNTSEIYRSSKCMGEGTRYDKEYEYKNPTTLIEFPKIRKGIHPTQKPVELIEYLISTYSDEGDTVLDNCMGSGTTGVACYNLNRNFIGMELNETYYNLAQARIKDEQAQIRMDIPVILSAEFERKLP